MNLTKRQKNRAIHRLQKASVQIDVAIEALKNGVEPDFRYIEAYINDAKAILKPSTTPRR